MSLVIGPRAQRNDLRQDLPRLSLLRTYPLRGTQVVAAALASPTLTLTALQVATVVLAMAMLPAEIRAQAGAHHLRLLVALSPLVLGALNATSFAIQNGVALMFPAWVWTGTDSSGIESFGQNILLMFGSFFALVVTLVLPVAAAASVIVLGRFLLGDFAIAAGLAASAAVLSGEVAWMVRRLGRLFERTEPSALF